MLNTTAIEAAMRARGLNGPALARACQVSKEAVSNWLSGESMPRPQKLLLLAEALGSPMDALLVPDETSEPVFAYRTKANRVPTGAAYEAAEEVARHLRQLQPFLSRRPEFEPPVLREPSLDERAVQSACDAVRASIRVAPAAPLLAEDLEGLFHSFGALLVPVLWGLDKERHENALSVYLPDTKTSWVVFNLGCKADDYLYWLAHEYGHCLTLHKIRGEDGETFAELFAKHLVFPDAAAGLCLQALQKSANPQATLGQWATRYGISVVTVVRGVDRVHKSLHGRVSGLEDNGFFPRWSKGRRDVPSMAMKLLETNEPTAKAYVDLCEKRFATPVFKALANMQRESGGRDPAFIANTLKIGIGAAIGLSYELWSRQD